MEPKRNEWWDWNDERPKQRTKYWKSRTFGKNRISDKTGVNENSSSNENATPQVEGNFKNQALPGPSGYLDESKESNLSQYNKNSKNNVPTKKNVNRRYFKGDREFVNLPKMLNGDTFNQETLSHRSYKRKQDRNACFSSTSKDNIMGDVRALKNGTDIGNLSVWNGLNFKIISQQIGDVIQSIAKLKRERERYSLLKSKDNCTKIRHQNIEDRQCLKDGTETKEFAYTDNLNNEMSYLIEIEDNYTQGKKNIFKREQKKRNKKWQKSVKQRLHSLSVKNPNLNNSLQQEQISDISTSNNKKEENPEEKSEKKVLKSERKNNSKRTVNYPEVNEFHNENLLKEGITLPNLNKSHIEKSNHSQKRSSSSMLDAFEISQGNEIYPETTERNNKDSLVNCKCSAEVKAASKNDSLQEIQSEKVEAARETALKEKQRKFKDAKIIPFGKTQNTRREIKQANKKSIARHTPVTHRENIHGKNENGDKLKTIIKTESISYPKVSDSSPNQSVIAAVDPFLHPGQKQYIGSQISNDFETRSITNTDNSTCVVNGEYNKVDIASQISKANYETLHEFSENSDVVPPCSMLGSEDFTNSQFVNNWEGISVKLAHQSITNGIEDLKTDLENEYVKTQILQESENLSGASTEESDSVTANSFLCSEELVTPQFFENLGKNPMKLAYQSITPVIVDSKNNYVEEDADTQVSQESEAISKGSSEKSDVEATNSLFSSVGLADSMFHKEREILSMKLTHKLKSRIIEDSESDSENENEETQISHESEQMPRGSIEKSDVVTSSSLLGSEEPLNAQLFSQGISLDIAYQSKQVNPDKGKNYVPGCIEGDNYGVEKNENDTFEAVAAKSLFLSGDFASWKIFKDSRGISMKRTHQSNTSFIEDSERDLEKESEETQISHEREQMPKPSTEKSGAVAANSLVGSEGLVDGHFFSEKISLGSSNQSKQVDTAKHSTLRKKQQTFKDVKI